MFRGNIMMKGYLKNPQATQQAFAGGWFHSGDLAVMAFYAQIERALIEAYDLASESIACNLMQDDAAESMDAFLEKRQQHG